MLTLELIKQAAARLKPHIHRTPVLTSSTFDKLCGRKVFFKCENFQRAGSFKIRGATNKILSLTEEEKERGVITFSSGNHAQAVALASRIAGTKALIAMPTDAPKLKVAATREYGAEVIYYDRQTQDREEFAHELAEREQKTLVPPYDDYLVLAGQGTCGLEFVDQVSDLDTIVVPCGGGGLFSGVSTAAISLCPYTLCFPVEPEGADDTRQSIARGERVTIPPPTTIADGLRSQLPGALTFPIIQKNADDVLIVNDDEIVEALKFLLFRMKILVEPSGAAGVAAVLFNRIPERSTRVGVVISGGNIDPENLANLISR